MNKRIGMSLMGVCVMFFFVFLWVGGWFLGQLPSNHWATFPGFLTTFLGCFGSAVLAVVLGYMTFGK